MKKKIVFYVLVLALIFGNCIGCSKKKSAKTGIANSVSQDKDKTLKSEENKVLESVEADSETFANVTGENVISTSKEAIKEDVTEEAKEDTKENVKSSTEITTQKISEITGEKSTASVANKSTIKETKNETTSAGKVVSDTSLSSVEMAKKMGCGYNLGNEFDASDCIWLSNEMEYEAAWSNAVTTRAFIHHIKELGFTTIRIPVSWHNHVDSSFNINKEWLDRVEEVVSWAYDEGLYVIINIHHDIDRSYIYPTYDCYESSKNYIEKIWGQLGRRFSGYGDRLIFEVMNEPRLKGEAYEWWVLLDDSRCLEAIEVINKLNNDFVSCVRKISGNENRFLMLTSYCDMYECAGDNLYYLPIDTANDKLLYTFHSYLPYNFTQELSSYSTFAASEKAANDKAFEAIYNTFVKKGIGVVLGEFGCIDKGNDTSRYNYYEYIAASAKKYNMSYIVWDNNAFSGDYTFGLIDRLNIRDIEDKILEALIR